jgi:DNA polymerase-3 subunit beta
METVIEKPTTTTTDEIMTDEELIAILLSLKPDPRFKVSLDPKACRQAIAYVAGAAPNKSTLPVLSMIHFSTNGQTVIKATDLDMTVTATLPHPAMVEGECLLPKAALLNAVKASKNSVLIELKPKLMADIVADTAKQTVCTLDVSEFPQLPKFEKQLSIKLSASKFKEAIKRVASAAASKNSGRYVLESVLLECTPDTITLVGTDGRRLHKTSMKRFDCDAVWQQRIKDAEAALKQAQAACKAADTTANKKANQKEVQRATHIYDSALRANIVVPSGAVNHLLKLPVDTADDLLVIETDQPVPQASYAIISYGPYTLTTKLIEGQYPNYKAVIPSECNERVTVVADELAAAIKQVSFAITDKCNSIKLLLTRHKLTVSANSPEKGEAKSEIAINYAGKDLTIAFAPKYILSTCAAFKGEDVAMELIDELSPGVFRKDQTLVVVMPMRLS